MEEFLRALYNSPISGAQLGHPVSPEEIKLMLRREELYEKLRKRLSEEDYNLLDDYDSLIAQISDEERYYTFLSGIKTFSEFLRAIFYDH